MVFVAELAHLAGRIDGDLVLLHRDVLQTLGLPTPTPTGAGPSCAPR